MQRHRRTQRQDNLQDHQHHFGVTEFVEQGHMIDEKRRHWRRSSP